MDNNRIYLGPPGSGKTYSAKRAIIELIWDSMEDEDKQKVDSIFYNPLNFNEISFNYAVTHYKPGICVLSLHDGMTVSDFIEGLVVVESNGSIVFQNRTKIVLELLEKMKSYPNKPAFLLFDDIHRLNTNAAFGELLYAFSHRGSHIITSSGRDISVPDNLYVFMTYNSLRPDYSFDIGLLSTFKIFNIYSSEEKLRAAIHNDFYKNAYYNINFELIKEYSDILNEWRELMNRYNESERLAEPISAVNAFISEMPDFHCCLDDDQAKRLVGLTFPLGFDEGATVKLKTIFKKLVKKYEECLLKIHCCYNEVYSDTAVNMLSDFIKHAVVEYRRYNLLLEKISPEYSGDREKYVIGFTYFLPGFKYSIWNADKLLQNKIRSQVKPLLYQYKKEGVISGNDDIELWETGSRFTREKDKITEDRISFNINESYRREFLNSFSDKNPSLFRQRGGLRYNANYGVIFELIYDMVQHPLINNWEIMDILLYSKNIYYKLDEGGVSGSCLLCNSNLSKNFRLGKSDFHSGNNNSVYRADLHEIFYKGIKYYLVSKMKIESKERTESINDCKLKGVVSRERSYYQMVKVLVYEYFNRFLKNLEAYRYEISNAYEIGAVEKEIQAVKDDLKTLDSLSLHGDIISASEASDHTSSGTTKNITADILRWNLLTDIRNLSTWRNMCNETIKGVYRIMDERYQSIMDSTGIHQMILQGPPGTSKTFGAKKFLAEQAGILNEDGTWAESDLRKIQLLSQGDSYLLPNDAKDSDNVFWDIIQFHPSYTYEDFVRGIAVSTLEKGKVEVLGNIFDYRERPVYSIKLDSPSSISYKTVNRTLGKMAKIARQYYTPSNPEGSKKFYLIIDEINRANLATVFGELIYALEYRDNEVVTPYAVENDKYGLEIPNNLYIIGTMNTADKSISSIDYAIRRRFLFFPVLPDIAVVFNSVKEKWEDSVEIKLFYIVDRFFELFMNYSDYNRNDIQIGHTYFLRKCDKEYAAEQMKNRFFYQIIPVLREYYNDGIIMENTDKDLSILPEEKSVEIIWEFIKATDSVDMDKKYNELEQELNDNSELNNALKKTLQERNIIPRD